MTSTVTLAIFKIFLIRGMRFSDAYASRLGRCARVYRIWGAKCPFPLAVTGYLVKPTTQDRLEVLDDGLDEVGCPIVLRQDSNGRSQPTKLVVLQDGLLESGLPMDGEIDREFGSGALPAREPHCSQKLVAPGRAVFQRFMRERDRALRLVVGRAPLGHVEARAQ